jgi:hypothetical protein
VPNQCPNASRHAVDVVLGRFGVQPALDCRVAFAALREARPRREHHHNRRNRQGDDRTHLSHLEGGTTGRIHDGDTCARTEARIRTTVSCVDLEGALNTSRLLKE